MVRSKKKEDKKTPPTSKTRSVQCPHCGRGQLTKTGCKHCGYKKPDMYK